MPWLDDVAAQAHAQLLACSPDHQPRAYLRERGVSDAQIAAYRLGYWQKPPTLQTCTPDFWKWVQVFGYDRLTFPLTDPFGTVIGVQGRHLGNKGYENFVLNPTELYVPVFGLHVALPAMFTSQRCVLVEGVFDYFAVLPYAPDVLSSLTANASNAVKRLLSRYVSMVVCLYDMDGPGRRGAYKLAGMEVPPEYRKPGDVTKRLPTPPPYTVLIQSYSAHDPDDLRKQGKTAELLHLTRPRSLTDVRVSAHL